MRYTNYGSELIHSTHHLAEFVQDGLIANQHCIVGTVICRGDDGQSSDITDGG